MGKQTAQGTRHETRLVGRIATAGREGVRQAKAGQKNEADVRISGFPMRPAVAWERWIGKKNDGRRRAVRMVTITEEHFIELLDADEDACYGYWVQCKSAQTISMSAVLEGLINWIRERT